MLDIPFHEGFSPHFQSKPLLAHPEAVSSPAVAAEDLEPGTVVAVADKQLQCVTIPHPQPEGAFGIPWLPNPRSSDIAQHQSLGFQGLPLKSRGSPG